MECSRLRTRLRKESVRRKYIKRGRKGCRRGRETVGEIAKGRTGKAV